jgi:hypothetical protein
MSTKQTRVRGDAVLIVLNAQCGLHIERAQHRTITSIEGATKELKIRSFTLAIRKLWMLMKDCARVSEFKTPVQDSLAANFFGKNIPESGALSIYQKTAIR